MCFVCNFGNAIDREVEFCIFGYSKDDCGFFVSFGDCPWYEMLVGFAFFFFYTGDTYVLLSVHRMRCY